MPTATTIVPKRKRITRKPKVSAKFIFWPLPWACYLSVLIDLVLNLFLVKQKELVQQWLAQELSKLQSEHSLAPGK
jgi:hypothetical protein